MLTKKSDCLYFTVCLFLQLMSSEAGQVQGQGQLINFRQFVSVLGVMCKSDVTQRVKLLYLMHLPPALRDSDPDPLASPAGEAEGES